MERCIESEPRQGQNAEAEDVIWVCQIKRFLFSVNSIWVQRDIPRLCWGGWKTEKSRNTQLLILHNKRSQLKCFGFVRPVWILFQWKVPLWALEHRFVARQLWESTNLLGVIAQNAKARGNLHLAFTRLSWIICCPCAILLRNLGSINKFRGFFFFYFHLEHDTS